MDLPAPESPTRDDQFVTGGDHGNRRTTHHADLADPAGGGQTQLVRPQHRAGPDQLVTGAEVLTGAADVRALLLRQFVHQHPGLAGAERVEQFGDEFALDDRVGLAGDGGARHDPHRLTGRQRRVGGRTCRDVADFAQGLTDGQPLPAHGETVHGRVVESGDVDPCSHRGGERPAGGVGDRDHLDIGDGVDQGEHLGQVLLHRQLQPVSHGWPRPVHAGSTGAHAGSRSARRGRADDRSAGHRPR